MAKRAQEQLAMMDELRAMADALEGTGDPRCDEVRVAYQEQDCVSSLVRRYHIALFGRGVARSRDYARPPSAICAMMRSLHSLGL
jgi:hypothetical protein